MTTTGRTTTSAQVYARALDLLPGGVSRNTVLRSPHPLYAARGEGCRVTDIEGVTRIDFANNMASLIHGHADPGMVQAVSDQVARGTAFTLATEIEVEYAEHIVSRNPAFEQIRFVNSGTEAVMAAIKAARAFTGRTTIAKVEGAYHGLYDFAEVSQTSAPGNWGEADHPRSVPVAHGTPESVLHDVVVIPFNDPETAEAILDEHRGEIACIITDLMPHRVGLVPATSEFVERLRAWADRDGSLLVFDEVITFRTEVGGLQQRYDVEPDLTALGKAIGGGFPVGAVVGRRDVMQVMNPLADTVLFPHSGTFSANPVTMSAGLNAMSRFDAHAVSSLNRLAEETTSAIAEAIGRAGVEACTTGAGSMFRVHLKASPPRNHREAYASPGEKERLSVLLDHLFVEGMIMINTCSATLSTPMTSAESGELVAALESGFARIA